MKNHLVLLACCLTMTTFGQSIILGTSPQIVPQGKKWILSTNKEILIEISGGTLRSGTLCNARILSIPKIVMGIIEVEYGNPNEVYSILFNELNSVAYANKYTYSIIPKSIVNSKFDFSELQQKDLDDIGSKQIVFFPGQKIYVGECLQSIQLIETNLTTKDLADLKRKEDELKLRDQKSKQVNEDIKIKIEQEKRNKILNSPNEYIDSYDLSNLQELELTLPEEALIILYEYIKEFNNQYLILYEDKLSEADKYSYYSAKKYHPAYDFFIYFDKSMNLTKVCLEGISIKGEGLKDFELNQSWFEKLKPYFKINKTAIVSFDNKDFFVNSKFPIFFGFKESLYDCNYQISVNKKKEISLFINNSRQNDMSSWYWDETNDKWAQLLTNEKALEIIKSSNNIISIEKGIYSVIISVNKIDFECANPNTHSENKIIKPERKIFSVKSLVKD